MAKDVSNRLDRFHSVFARLDARSSESERLQLADNAGGSDEPLKSRSLEELN